MAQDAPPDALYDFLYRDSNRITSYYAQLFSGRLTALEETDLDREAAETNASVSVKLLGGGVKKTDDTQRTQKRTIDPHDLITVDVLSRLRDDNLIYTDAEAAPHGGLFLAQGTLLFIDKHMMEMASIAFHMALKQEQQKPKSQQDRQQINQLTILHDFLAKFTLPSAFLLQTASGVNLAGTIKEAGMEEPISTYYFKHGTAGLSRVYLIGIKEVPSESEQLPITQIIGAGQQAAEGLRNMLFPPDAIRATPIALFREL